MNTVIGPEGARSSGAGLSQRSLPRACAVVFVAALFFFYEFVQLNMLNSLSPYLLADFGLTATQLGQLSAYYFYSNLLFLLPAGMILDHYSSKKVILISLLICVLGTAGFSLAHSFAVAAVFRFFTGIGSAFCFLSCVRLASRWFFNTEMARAMGTVVTIGMAGGMVAQAPLNFVIQSYGWRHALLADAALGAVIWLVIALVVADHPPGQVAAAAAARAEQTVGHAWAGFKQAFGQPQNWLCGIYTCLLNLPIFLLGALWGSLYLEQVVGLDASQAAWVASMVFVGALIGSPVMGWWSDRWQLRRAPMLIGAVLSLVLVLALMYMPLNFYSALLLFLALGFITSTQVISYPTVAESNPTAFTATCVSVISINAIGAGALFQPLFGWLMDRHWNHQIVQGVPQYSPADYQLALWILPASFLVALLAALKVRETYARRTV